MCAKKGWVLAIELHNINEIDVRPRGSRVDERLCSQLGGAVQGPNRGEVSADTSPKYERGMIRRQASIVRSWG